MIPQWTGGFRFAKANQRVALAVIVSVGWVVWNGVCPAVAANPSPADSSSTRPLYLYLLIGQSNMAGRGIIEEEDRQQHPRVLALNKNTAWELAADPIHFDKPVAGVGPGLTFGKLMANAFPEANIGLIPCACGGTSIKAWLKDAPPDKTFGSIYANTLERARLAMKAGQLKGILWHQGSSDVRNTGTYRDNLVRFVTDLRRDLGAPEVPFVAGLQPEFKTDPGIAKINDATKSVAETLPNYAVVTAKGLVAKTDDPIHLDSASAREFGRRYALAMQALMTHTLDPAARDVIEAMADSPPK